MLLTINYEVYVSKEDPESINRTRQEILRRPTFFELGANLLTSRSNSTKMIVLILVQFLHERRNMAQLKKGLRTIRSREDYDLFKLTLPSYDPQLLSGIRLCVGPGDYLKPGVPLAIATLRPKAEAPQPSQSMNAETGQEYPLTTYLSGRVEKVGPSFEEREGIWTTKEGLKRGMLELGYIRQCEHIIKKQSINDITAESKSSEGEVCQLCHKEVWAYVEPEQQQVTAQDLLSANDGVQLRDLEQLEWSIIINEQFTPTTAIAKVGQKDLNYPVLAKAVYLIGEGQKPKANTTVMTIRKVICKHEKIYENRCQFCLKMIDQNLMSQFNRYLFQLGPNGSWKGYAKGAALVQQEENYISGIIAKQRGILILDLDNTILHSNEMSDLQLSSLFKVKEYFMIPKLDQVPSGKVKQDFIIVKMRPYFKEFLFTISKLFEVYVYTKGTRIYADEICRWVRAQWAGENPPYDFSTWNQKPQHFLKDTQCFVPYRVVSRNEDTSLDTKSMQNILPNRTEYHLILDDRRDVWANSPSWFYTRDYFYFYKRPLNPNKPQEPQDISDFIESEENPVASKIADCYNRMRQDYPERKDINIENSQKPDYFLLYASHTLKKIHSYFFEGLKKHKEDKEKNKVQKGAGQENSQQKGKDKDKEAHPVSMASIMQRLKLFLGRKKLRFFLPPGDEGISTVRRAIKMGAYICKRQKQQTPDFVIRGNSFMKFIKKRREEANDKEAKLKQQQDKKKEKEPELKVSQQVIEQIEEKVLNRQTDIIKEAQNVEVGVGPAKQDQMGDYSVIESSPLAVKSQPEPVKQLPKKQQVPIDYEEELKQLQKWAGKSIPVIAQTWILACYEFSYKFKSQEFRLTDPFKEEVDHSDYNQPIARAAEKIKKEITEQMTKQL